MSESSKRPSDRAPLAEQSIAILGAGGVGGAFAAAFQKKGLRIAAILSANEQSAKRLARQVHCRFAITDIEKLPDEISLLIIAVPDGVIQELAEAIAARAPLHFRSLTALHTSGALSSDALQPLRERGAGVGSIHPLQMFPRSQSLKERAGRLFGIPFTIEGTKRATLIARQIVQLFSGRAIAITREKKPLYHAAAVFASNYLITTLSAANEVLRASIGKPEKIFEPIVRSSIQTALLTSPEEALTGPIERGDAATVQRHLRALNASLPHLVPLYVVLGMETVRIAAQKGSLSEKQMTDLLKLFIQAISTKSIKSSR
ncbi:MAG: Rossmann-like and DUF2520 domain-containing protein [Bacteroidota bacterium]